MERQVFDQGLERIGLGDKVCYAVHFNQHRNLAVEMDVAVDEPLGGVPAGELLALGDATFPQEIDRLLDVPVGLLERLLAVHHARAGAIPKLGDFLWIDLRHARFHLL